MEGFSAPYKVMFQSIDFFSILRIIPFGMTKLLTFERNAMKKMSRILALLPILISLFAVSLWAHGDPSGSIQESDIIRHIKVLASDSLEGRRTGEPGCAKAANYIESQFKKIGLLPGGVNGTYRQSFEVVAASELGANNGLKVDGKALEIKKQWMPLSYTKAGEAKGKLVFAGFGITALDFGYDDYAGLEVKDKIVVVLKYGPEGDDPRNRYNRYFPIRSKAMNAREHGAAAILIAASNDTFPDDPVSRLRHDWAPGDAGILVAGLDLGTANLMLEKGGKGNLNAIAIGIAHSTKPNSFEIPTEVEVACTVTKRMTKTDNILGYFEGGSREAGAEIVVVGAHYDHLGRGGPESLAPKAEGSIHHGADDNASGTAGLLELAEAFAQRKNFLRRSILFIAFSGEEEGVLGSNFYVKNPTLPFEKVVAMINMDMIGRMKDSLVVVQGAGTSPIWKELVSKANEKVGLQVRFNEDGYGPSDHSSFYSKDKPVLFFFSGVHTDYHKPTDTWEKINALGEERILKLAFNSIDAIQNLDTPPAFARTQRDSSAMMSGGDGGGLRAYLGSIPDYAEEVTGVKLSGVREGSPAEKAGIKGGDVIVRFAGKEIKNVYDYTYVLGACKPGQVVEIGIMREGKLLTLTATLDWRK